MDKIDKPNINWDKSVVKYHEYALKYPLYKQTSKKLVELAELNKEDIVIELGCGTGITTKMIAKRVKKVIAIDRSKKAIEIAKKYVNNNVDFICGDIFDIKGINSKKVLANLCISIIISKESKKIKNFLKPNGIFYFNVPSQYMKNYGNTKLIKEIKSLLEAHGYNLPKREHNKRYTKISIEKKLDLKLTKIYELNIKRVKKDLVKFYSIPIFRYNLFGNIPSYVINKVLKEITVAPVYSTCIYFKGKLKN